MFEKHVQVQSLSGHALIQLDSEKKVSLHELVPMVQFECRTLKVRFVLRTGDLTHPAVRTILSQSGKRAPR